MKDNGITFLVNAEYSGIRVDKFLAEKIKDKSRSFIQKLIEDGKVRVNNKVVSKNYRVESSDVVNLKYSILNTSSIKIKPQKIKLNIVYEDNHILVISKPAGLVTHPSPGHSDRTLVNAILGYSDKIYHLQKNLERAGVVHRLDKNTSGLIIVAKDSDTQRSLSGQFKSRKVKKVYDALVWGAFTEEKGEINLPIGRSRADRKKMGVVINGGKEAVTRFKVLKKFSNCCLIEVIPLTGRTHQIRVHLSYIGHPIIGDKDYGNSNSNKLSADLRLERQFLHAKKLVFTHPVLNKKLVLEDELAYDLKNSLDVLRRENNMGE